MKLAPLARCRLLVPDAADDHAQTLAALACRFALQLRRATWLSGAGVGWKMGAQCGSVFAGKQGCHSGEKQSRASGGGSVGGACEACDARGCGGAAGGVRGRCD